jgi:hypothetical protein
MPWPVTVFRATQTRVVRLMGYSPHRGSLPSVTAAPGTENRIQKQVARRRALGAGELTPR